MSDEKKEKGFTVHLRDDGIIIVTLYTFARWAVEAWMDYVLARNGKLRSPLRLLYDFRQGGAPSQFLLETVGPFMERLIIPEDTRNAYVFARGPYQRFAHSFLRRMPDHVGDIKAFADIDEAVKWLLHE